MKINHLIKIVFVQYEYWENIKSGARISDRCNMNVNKSTDNNSILLIQILGKYKVRGKDIGPMLYECRKIY